MSKQINAINKRTKRTIRFNSVSEAAHYFNVSISAISHHKKINTPLQDYIFEDADPCQPKKKTLKGEGMGGKGNILQYEVSENKVCITPCPFREDPKPFVGNGECMDCRYFADKCIKTRKVRCKFSIGYSKTLM